MTNIPWRLAVLGVAAVFPSATVAQPPHRHPPQDQAIHDRFYATWMKPDDPTQSCCNWQDCYPTQVRFKDGQWFARRREDGKFLLVPPEKIERRRESPDGRNHLCAPAPHLGYGDAVFCFVPGAGL